MDDEWREPFLHYWRKGPNFQQLAPREIHRDCSMPTQASLEGLPTELRLDVLKHLSSFADLKATLLAGPLLYNTITEEEHAVAATVLDKEIPVELLPEAFFAFKSLQWHREWSERGDYEKMKSVQDLLAEYHDDRLSALQRQPNLLEAMEVYKTYARCEFLTTTVIHELFKAQSSWPGQVPGWPTPLTLAETNRIRYALLRYDAYCNLFGKAAWLKANFDLPKFRRSRLLGSMICSPYTGFENEQLRQVMKILYIKLLEVYCPHENSFDYRDRRGCMCIHDIMYREALTGGLGFLGQMFQSTSEKERRELMQWVSCPRFNLHSLLIDSWRVGHVMETPAFFPNPDNGLHGEFDDERQRFARVFGREAGRFPVEGVEKLFFNYRWS